MKNIVIDDSILKMDSAAMTLWINILMRADENGVLKTSLRKLAEVSGLSIQQVRRVLATQVATHQATQVATQLDTTITICNYDRYKGSKNESDTPSNTPSNIVGNTPKEISSFSLDRNEKESTKEKDKINLNTISQENKKETMCKHIEKKEAGALLSFAGTAEKKECKKSSAPLFDYSMIPAELKSDFLEFVDMRKKIRAPIHTQRAVNARWATLNRLSGGDIGQARKIIRQSLENEWQNFYALHQDGEEEKLREKKKSSFDDYSDKKYWS